MKLHIENVAKIKEADIEFNGITVIAGKNNTGKSTVGKVLYCVMKGFHNVNQRIMEERIDTIYKGYVLKGIIYRDKLSEYIKKNQKNDLISYIKNTIIIDEYTGFNEYNLITKVNEILDLPDKAIVETILNSLLNKSFYQQISPMFNIKQGTECIALDNKIKLRRTHIFEAIDYTNIEENVIYIDDPNELDYIGTSTQFPKTLTRFDLDYKGQLLEAFCKKQNDNAVEQTLFQMNIKPVIDMINTIINGNFVNRDNMEMLLIPGLREPLNIHNLSMGVKVILTLKKLIENGSITNNTVLIMDEPEIHLHPEWQLKLAEILVMLQKEMNVKLLINTHSPYFINAIEVYSAKNNLADRCKYYLSYLEEERAYFKDVSGSVDEIYKLLAEPMNYLDDLTYEN